MYFDSPSAISYSKSVDKAMGIVAVRKLMHTRSCDILKGIKAVDGYVCPLEFCDIAMAESLFRNAKQYFYHISRKVETYSEIAKSIGESVYYTDNDIYYAAANFAREKFGTNDLRTLSTSGKIELAKCLRYDYNAGDKQL